MIERAGGYECRTVEAVLLLGAKNDLAEVVARPGAVLLVEPSGETRRGARERGALLSIVGEEAETALYL